MCETHLKIEREDLDPDDTALLFDQTHSTPAKLLHFVRHCEADAFFQMAVAFKVQALPLTRQLTNLAGNSWWAPSRSLDIVACADSAFVCRNKTLAGNRAERNEYILLHRFNENGFVCPDKFNFFERKAAEAKARTKAKGKAKEDKDETELIVAKKEKYKGGLVFEPQRGLWDRFVLVMDFNSLYPSIIQEYDIDFSTIDWTADGVSAVFFLTLTWLADAFLRRWRIPKRRRTELPSKALLKASSLSSFRLSSIVAVRSRG